MASVPPAGADTSEYDRPVTLSVASAFGVSCPLLALSLLPLSSPPQPAAVTRNTASDAARSRRTRRVDGRLFISPASLGAVAGASQRSAGGTVASWSSEA